MIINIIYVLNDFISWKSLKYSKFIESTSTCHYKSIHKKHILWSNNKVHSLKNHNKILVRRDKLINTYLGCIYNIDLTIAVYVSTSKI